MSQHTAGPWTRTGPFKGSYTVHTEHEQIRVVRGDTARLIAASPELLDQLAVLAYWCELDMPNGMPQSVLANAKLAIAKATS